MAYHKSFHSLLIVVSTFFQICSSIDTITQIQSVRDGETLTSAGKNFVLGFFSPANSKNRYIGIWYNKIPDQTVVWVANRENPVRNSSGILTINGGNLVVLLCDEGYNNTTTPTILWSTNISTVSNYSSARLMDSGNLVLIDNHETILWQSLDYPTDTFLPRMKLGLDRRTGLNRLLTSWRSTDDPAPGEFSFGLDPRGMPQYFLRKGSDPLWRSEPWNGLRLFSMQGTNPSFMFTLVANDDEIYYMYNKNDSSIFARTVLDVSGVFRRLMWTTEKHQWNVMWVAVQDRCDRYENCGAYGSCDSNRLSECSCLKGFEPKVSKDWNLRDWSDGCVRRRPLDCAGIGDRFWKLVRVKLPDTSRSRVEPTLSLNECKEDCLRSCSCTAYASANFSGEGSASGCVIWYGNLTDLKVYSDEGQDIYIRMAASELDKDSYEHSRGFQGKKILIVTILTVISLTLLFCLCGYCWWKKEKGWKMNERCGGMFNDNEIEVLNDQTRSIMLDWRRRFNIIVGIARGILYLHEDSRLRIIHRDLKVSNILLDDDMNPKFSDFGMARLFRGNQTQANTNRVVGTYGYMSPEYAMNGLFSIKSDVFSFGVILLEIISGKRNSCYNDCRSMNLIGHVWELWKEGRILELVDSSMSVPAFASEVLRCIQVGLLCVQQKAKDRPNMSSIIFMLCNERGMPSPKKPAFCFWKGNYFDHPHESTNGIDGCSKNDVTITEIEAR